MNQSVTTPEWFESEAAKLEERLDLHDEQGHHKIHNWQDAQESFVKLTAALPGAAAAHDSFQAQRRACSALQENFQKDPSELNRTALEQATNECKAAQTTWYNKEEQVNNYLKSTSASLDELPDLPSSDNEW
jgi:hypothetical protein